MKCDDPRISAYYDGEVEAELARAVENHLEGCHHCQATLDEMSHLSDELALFTVPEAPPDSVSLLIEALTPRPTPMGSLRFLLRRVIFHKITVPFPLVIAVLIFAVGGLPEGTSRDALFETASRPVRTTPKAPANLPQVVLSKTGIDSAQELAFQTQLVVMGPEDPWPDFESIEADPDRSVYLEGLPGDWAASRYKDGQRDAEPDDERWLPEDLSISGGPLKGEVIEDYEMLAGLP